MAVCTAGYEDLVIKGHDIYPSAYRTTPSHKPTKIKEIKIEQLDHGYVLTVGCKKIALDTPAKIIFGLKLYLNNPEKVEKAFLEGKFKFEK